MNLPMYLLDADAVTARNAEYAGTPFTDIPGDGSYADNVLGCNKAGSCAPGIGIATDNIDPKLEDWSVNDQDGAPRDPQLSQHIGGSGLGEGSGLASVINAVVNPNNTPIIDQTMSFIAAVVQAAVGAGYNTAAGDPVNRSSRTIEIGERLWGTNTP